MGDIPFGFFETIIIVILSSVIFALTTFLNAYNTFKLKKNEGFFKFIRKANHLSILFFVSILISFFTHLFILNLFGYNEYSDDLLLLFYILALVLFIFSLIVIQKEKLINFLNYINAILSILFILFIIFIFLEIVFNIT